MARSKKIINPTSRTRTIDLDGKQFTIEFTFHGYATMKELTGISLLMGWDPSAMDAKEIACFLYSGLLKHQSDIELDFCFDSLRGDNFSDVYSALLEAYTASLPKPKEDADPTQPIAKKS
jgi:hypothetical protein